MTKVILTGGNGFIGKHLQKALNQKGIPFSILTRSPKADNEFLWNIEEQYIDTKVFDGATCIIHLAGENIGQKRWTSTQKQKIIESRVKSTELLYKYLSQIKHQITSFIAASGASYYGEGNATWQDETLPNGQGFLAEVAQQWETSSLKMATLGIPTYCLRTGVVLDKHEGAFPKLLLPIKYNMGVYFGNGLQYLPWIHINDIVDAYLFFLLQQPKSGIYNVVSPNPISNKELTQILAKRLNKFYFPFGIPKFILKTILGDMAEVLLISNRCSANKIIEAGFQFKFTTIDEALNDLLS